MDKIYKQMSVLQPEPSRQSHLVNFAGLANFSLDKNGIYEEFQV